MRSFRSCAPNRSLNVEEIPAPYLFPCGLDNQFPMSTPVACVRVPSSSPLTPCRTVFMRMARGVLSVAVLLALLAF